MSFTLADGLTLKNKLGAATHDQLEQLEHPKLAQRLIELYEGRGPEPTFDTAHLQALHKHLFQDVFEWAGHLRHQPFTFEDGTQAISLKHCRRKNLFTLSTMAVWSTCHKLTIINIL
ncbi:hypothetical protein GOD17_05315 [Sinorhizobium medicae]|nr:hypothetical protein [Sinorhizobium medicae]